MSMKDIKNLVHLCHGKNIYIQTHDFPDPDAIASAYGLQKLLKHFEIDAVSCYAGKIDRRSAAKMLTAFQIDIFSYDHMKKHMTKDDAIICVDSQAKNNNVTDFAGKEIGCIDHQRGNRCTDNVISCFGITRMSAALDAYCPEIIF